MQNNQSFSSVLENISTINRGSGLSNNMMAYRLALIIEKNQPEAQSSPTLDTSERESLLFDLRTALSQNTQNVENYRQALKNKYYTEYLNKFGVAQQSTAVPQQDNSTRVDNLIAEKKQTFLQKMFDARQHELPLGQKAKNIDKVSEVIPPESIVSPQSDEVVKKSLIPSVIKTVLTMGKDTENQGRIYEGIAYRLQLLIKEGMQLVSVKRKSGNPETAFTAYKDDSNEFKITQNNLSDQETNRLIAFSRQQTKQQPKTQDNQISKNDNTELGE
ncbi:hypothetical protein LC605_26705 [Nostoc sp. CHAB 5836]|uniref:hypothetical protein n=1 Tax=Nostoc sp. CHAB 5836 TaxID=2780404 RepID=UPI001E56D779|nr:hypothetical protein [Nostoc sp. CHAB 5836]MCC5618615.1 hypothetical protein [Nostoc sp. CHAB 5836]